MPDKTGLGTPEETQNEAEVPSDEAMRLLSVCVLAH